MSGLYSFQPVGYRSVKELSPVSTPSKRCMATSTGSEACGSKMPNINFALERCDIHALRQPVNGCKVRNRVVQASNTAGRLQVHANRIQEPLPLHPCMHAMFADISCFLLFRRHELNPPSSIRAKMLLSLHQNLNYLVLFFHLFGCWPFKSLSPTHTTYTKREGSDLQ